MDRRRFASGLALGAGMAPLPALAQELGDAKLDVIMTPSRTRTRHLVTAGSLRPAL
jgi:hypothetical protein